LHARQCLRYSRLCHPIFSHAGHSRSTADRMGVGNLPWSGSIERNRNTRVVVGLIKLPLRRRLYR
jgi:hypothetical protein